jgi:F-type H+-transporting ATPase subunit a
MPFLWTIFFFILFNNLLGLVPLLDIQHLFSKNLRDSHSAYIGGTATQNIAVTAVLAILSFLVVNIAGIRELGIKGYFGHMTGGAPIFVAPLIFVLELIGTFIKPVALAIRLFANMTAGHILMAVLFGFAATGVSLLSKSPLLGGGITLASFLGAVAINLLELFVAVLQAFVFMFLTAVFISQLSHHHDEHEHHGEHDHEHAHA